MARSSSAGAERLPTSSVSFRRRLRRASDAGGERAAILYSLVATCKAHGIDPWAYLRDVLARIPTRPYRRRAELLPQPWSRPDDPRVAGAGGTLPSATRPGDERQQEARREV